MIHKAHYVQFPYRFSLFHGGLTWIKTGKYGTGKLNSSLESSFCIVIPFELGIIFQIFTRPFSRIAPSKTLK